MTRPTGAEPVYAITLHQPWASLIALGLKTVETRSWPAPARLVGQRIAVHAGRRVVRQPGAAIERELREHLGNDWRRAVPAGAVLATATLAGVAKVERVDLLTNQAIHDVSIGIGHGVPLGGTNIDPWGDFSPDRWLWFLSDVRPFPEPIPAVGHQSFWHWDIDGG